MRHRIVPVVALSLFGLAVGLSGLPPSTGSAQPQAGQAVAGTWQLVGTVQQNSATVQQVIDPVIALVTPDLQRFARARVAETTWVPQTILVEAAPDRIHVVYQGAENRSFDTPPNQPQNVYSRSGVRAQMVQSFRPDGGIEQRFTAIDGVQTNILTPAGGSRMTLTVNMTAPRLPQGINFQLAFTR